MTTTTDLAWLAGIIDGEGSVSLSHGGTRSPHLRISIYNGDPNVIAKVSRVLDVLALYPLVRPHLTRQVECLDAGADFMRPKYRRGRQRVYWTAAERAEWEALRARFHNLVA